MCYLIVAYFLNDVLFYLDAFMLQILYVCRYQYFIMSTVIYIATCVDLVMTQQSFKRTVQ